MAEFSYSNAKHASIGYTPFELNCGYYRRVPYKQDVDLYSRSKVADELTEKFRNLMAVYRENLKYAQELQKQAYNKGSQPRSYTFGKKIWLNSKYIKTKRNQKLEAKFFGPFQVLYPVGSQAYKLKLPKKWTIYNVFYVSLLEQDITKKGQVDEKIVK